MVQKLIPFPHGAAAYGFGLRSGHWLGAAVQEAGFFPHVYAALAVRRQDISGLAVALEAPFDVDAGSTGTAGVLFALLTLVLVLAPIRRTDLVIFFAVFEGRLAYIPRQKVG